MAWYDSILLRITPIIGKVSAKGSRLTKEELDANFIAIINKIDSIAGGNTSTGDKFGNIAAYDEFINFQTGNTVTTGGGRVFKAIQPSLNKEPISFPTYWEEINISEAFALTSQKADIQNADLDTETIDGVQRSVYNYSHNRDSLNVSVSVRDADGWSINVANKIVDSNTVKLVFDEAIVGTYQITVI